MGSEKRSEEEREHLLKMKQPRRALHVVSQDAGLASDQEWMLRVVEARALWDLGRTVDAKRAAGLAVFKAPSEAKANNLREYLAEMLGTSG